MPERANTALSASELLNAASVGREVAKLAALCLIQTKGDPEAALQLLDYFAALPECKPVGDELDAATIAAQAIREAVAERG